MSYNIILLDTDRQHADLIKEHLKRYPEYQIHIFTDAAACIAQLKTLKPSVIFLDAELKHDPATMKEETELLVHLKELSPSSEIILYSGEEKLELMLDKVRGGIHGFAVKSTETHVKAEMLLLSAIRHYRKAKELRFYKMLTILLFIAVIVAVIFAVVAYKANLVHDNVGGPFDD